MEDKNIIIISRISVASYLAGRGHKFIGTIPDKNNNDYNVFLFAYDDTIYDDMNDYKHIGFYTKK